MESVWLWKAHACEQHPKLHRTREKFLFKKVKPAISPKTNKPDVASPGCWPPPSAKILSSPWLSCPPSQLPLQSPRVSTVLCLPETFSPYVPAHWPGTQGPPGAPGRGGGRGFPSSLDAKTVLRAVSTAGLRRWELWPASGERAEGPPRGSPPVISPLPPFLPQSQTLLPNLRSLLRETSQKPLPSPSPWLITPPPPATAPSSPAASERRPR